MTIRDDIVFDKNGFVTPADITQPESDNGVLFTSEYYVLLDKLGLLTPGDRLDFIGKMTGISRDGNITRRERDTGQEGPDDYIGLCTASSILNLPFSELIYRYGSKNWWIYNTASPGKFTFEAWFGRQLGLIGYIKHCAGHRMNPLEFIVLNVGLVITAFGKKEDTSDKILGLLMVEQLHTSLLFEPICFFYTYMINRKYGSVNALIKTYFGPNHAFSKYWR